MKIEVLSRYGKPLYLSPKQHELRLAILASNHSIQDIVELSGVSYNAIGRWMTGLNEPSYHLYKATLDAIEQLKEVPKINFNHERKNIYEMRESGMLFKEIAKKYNSAYGSVYSAYWTYKNNLNKSLQSI